MRILKCDDCGEEIGSIPTDPSKDPRSFLGATVSATGIGELDFEDPFSVHYIRCDICRKCFDMKWRNLFHLKGGEKE
jgi:hypothetical protein